jgi:hypothetical protein
MEQRKESEGTRRTRKRWRARKERSRRKIAGQMTKDEDKVG